MAEARTQTYINTYTHYEPGDWVIVQNPRCPFFPGAYRVKAFHPPSEMGDVGSVLIEGAGGYLAAYNFRPAGEEEIQGLEEKE